ncbi:hypothetical protein L3Q82_003928 [Scortum barcoo]|uniref:Uncharacterized protein n=1 Tax=Scortum barcoo TaxID=214431 RepID=A0ACB8X665_9TELE|nr:hypothetical protein L3Q82_003928 [Scortum barcoo]
MLGGSISKKDTSRLDKLIRRAGSVVGMKLDSLVTVAESRTLDKLLDIMDNASHPLHTVISNQRSLFSERLLLPKCRTNRLKNSFGEDDLQDPAAHHADLLCLCVHEGVEVPESQDEHFAGRVQFDKDVLREGRIRLHVSRLRTDDSGLYLCEVSTNYGFNIGKCRLNVTESPESPTRESTTRESTETVQRVHNQRVQRNTRPQRVQRVHNQRSPQPESLSQRVQDEIGLNETTRVDSAEDGHQPHQTGCAPTPHAKGEERHVVVVDFLRMKMWILNGRELEKMICRILLLITLTSCVCVLHEGVEVPESQDEHFAGRVQFDKDVLREGRIRLHVSRLRTDDSGLYLCEVNNKLRCSAMQLLINLNLRDQQRVHNQRVQNQRESTRESTTRVHNQSTTKRVHNKRESTTRVHNQSPQPESPQESQRVQDHRVQESTESRESTTEVHNQSPQPESPGSRNDRHSQSMYLVCYTAHTTTMFVRREKMICRILLLITLTSCVCGTFVVNVTQSSYQAEENQNITLEWTFTIKKETPLTSIYIYCRLFTDLKHFTLFRLHEGVEVPESQDEHFAGRVQFDKDVLREGRIRLHVSRLRTDDSGLYVCEVSTDYAAADDLNLNLRNQQRVHNQRDHNQRVHNQTTTRESHNQRVHNQRVHNQRPQPETTTRESTTRDHNQRPQPETTTRDHNQRPQPETTTRDHNQRVEQPQPESPQPESPRQPERPQPETTSPESPQPESRKEGSISLYLVLTAVLLALCVGLCFSFIFCFKKSPDKKGNVSSDV